MLDLQFTTEDIETLFHERLRHPHPLVQKKMDALYLTSQGLSQSEVSRLCRLSRATLGRYRQAYHRGGVAALREIPAPRRENELAATRTTVEAYLQEHPPATVAQAGAVIEELTGLRRGPTQVRTYLHSLGMKPRQVGQIPAKADVVAQETFKTEELEPRLKAAQAGEGKVFFLDAAHFVYAPFLGILWCVTRLFVQAPAGRERLNVLGAVDAVTKELFTVHNLSYITAQTICEMLYLLAGVHEGVAITLVLDNARYQKCRLVQEVAEKLGITLLYLPPYSPNLNLIERLWKFVKKKSLYGKYYARKEEFQGAILGCLREVNGKYQEEMKSLLTLKFQTFKEVPIVGEEGRVMQFPGLPAQPANVSSQAA
jgi:transposase